MIDRITVYRYATYNDIFRKPEGFCADYNDNCVEKYEIEIPNDPMIEDVYTTDWGRICFKFKEKYYPMHRKTPCFSYGDIRCVY